MTMRLEISELHHQLKTTMIYVTHVQVEAMTMADKIVVLNAGNIVQVGSPLDLYRAPRNLFVAGFIGSPKMKPDRRCRKPRSTVRRRSACGPSIFGSRPRRRLDGHRRRRRASRLGHLPACPGRRPIGPLTVRTSGDVAVDHGDHVWLTPDPARIHRFDGEARRSDMHERSDRGRLDGKSAMITGAGRGIGLAFAEAYIREGARVAIRDINLEAADAAAAGSDRRRIAVRLDVSDQALIDQAAVDTVAARRPAASTSSSTMRRSSTSHPSSNHASELRQAVFRQRRGNAVYAPGGRAGHDRGRTRRQDHQHGKPGGSPRREALVGVYCATKAAVISLTQSAGLDLIGTGINVNADRAGRGRRRPLGPCGFPLREIREPRAGGEEELVGEAVSVRPHGHGRGPDGHGHLLARRESDYVVAQTYNVDGGNWMS